MSCCWAEPRIGAYAAGAAPGCDVALHCVLHSSRHLLCRQVSAADQPAVEHWVWVHHLPILHQHPK